MDEASIARRYYEAVDAGDYGALESLLAPEFRHVRPDRTIEGRARFVSFMAEERPRTDTVHAVDAFMLAVEEGGGDADADADARGDGDDDNADDAGVGRRPAASEVAVRGRLFGDDGEELFAFVDVFRVVDDTVVELRTFTG